MLKTVLLRPNDPPEPDSTSELLQKEQDDLRKRGRVIGLDHCSFSTTAFDLSRCLIAKGPDPPLRDTESIRRYFSTYAPWRQLPSPLSRRECENGEGGWRQG